MKVYAVRMCHGQWAVSSDEGVLLTFERYDEAMRAARSAVWASKPEGCVTTAWTRLAHPPHHRDTMGEEGPFTRGSLA